MCARTYACMRAYVRACVRVCMHACMRACVYVQNTRISGDKTKKVYSYIIQPRRRNRVR